jgi:pimeloyl-ACP methyl ester carboxylesterase
VAVAQAMTTVAKFLWPIPDSGLRRRLYRIAAPTLVLFGESDAVVPPSYGADFAAAIPNATSETVAGAGHLLTSDRPDEVIDRVVGFLGG